MDAPASAILAAAGGYLVGSLSFSKMLAALRGVDLRAVGSGNLGATNVGRALGWPAGIAVYILDAAKGWLPAALALRWGGAEHGLLDAAAAGGFAVAGHVWPLYDRFRGGKGVATLSGAALALAPEALLWAAIAFLLIVAVSRYMSLGSLTLGACLPLAMWLGEGAGAVAERAPVLAMLAVSGALVFYTHRSNIARLLGGTENRLGGKRG